VPVEELESYGTMLVQFYAREAITNTNLPGVLAPLPAAAPAHEQNREGKTGPAPGEPRQQ